MEKNHYVNNKEFQAAMVAHKRQVEAAKKEGLPKPKVSEYIGECILKIAQRVSYKPNFASYSYREEMVSDAIENCLLYIDNYNPDKFSNPFSYFTQITYYAFLRRIQKEKRQLYIKYKSIEEVKIEMDDPHIKATLDSFMTDDYSLFMSDFMEAFEKAHKTKKKKTKSSLDTLIDEETISDGRDSKQS